MIFNIAYVSRQDENTIIMCRFNVFSWVHVVTYYDLKWCLSVNENWFENKIGFVSTRKFYQGIICIVPQKSLLFSK